MRLNGDIFSCGEDVAKKGANTVISGKRFSFPIVPKSSFFGRLQHELIPGRCDDASRESISVCSCEEIGLNFSLSVWVLPFPFQCAPANGSKLIGWKPFGGLCSRCTSRYLLLLPAVHMPMYLGLQARLRAADWEQKERSEEICLERAHFRRGWCFLPPHFFHNCVLTELDTDSSFWFRLKDAKGKKEPSFLDSQSGVASFLVCLLPQPSKGNSSI